MIPSTANISGTHKTTEAKLKDEWLPMVKEGRMNQLGREHFQGS